MAAFPDLAFVDIRACDRRLASLREIRQLLKIEPRRRTGKLQIIYLPFSRHISYTGFVVMVRSLPIKKILVVDDNPVMLKVLSLSLKTNGYEVFTAVDGPEAFSIVRQEKPDLILLDIFFPPDAFQSGNTWDAFLIMHWLQRMDEPQARQIPVFVISGAEPEEFRNRCLAAGAANYFQKPIKIPELVDAIQEFSLLRMCAVPLELATRSNADRLRL
jgi:CheY-like chemotaxis protein